MNHDDHGWLEIGLHGGRRRFHMYTRGSHALEDTDTYPLTKSSANKEMGLEELLCKDKHLTCKSLKCLSFPSIYKLQIPSRIATKSLVR